MTIFLRIVTTAILFVFLFALLAIGLLMIGGAISGMLHANAVDAHGFSGGYSAGYEAGQRFGIIWGGKIIICSFIFSLVASSLLSFSNIFPWCRSKPQAPPLP